MKAVKIIGSIAVIAGLAIVTGGAALGLGLALSTTAFGISAGSLILAGGLLSTAGSLLSARPRAPEVSASTADRLQVNVDLRTGRKIIFGSTAMATDLRDQEFSADQSYLHRFVVVASHRVAAIREIWFDDKLAWTLGSGVTSAFAGYLMVAPILEGSAANAINIGPRMGSTRRYTGCAYVYFRYKLTGNSKKAESPFASAVPTRVTIVGDGALTYDPRLDSTVPGGSGPMRANDQTTWAWSATGSRNLALQNLWYLLGWRIRNPVTGVWKLAVGKGLPANRINLESYITAANLCDEAVARSAGGTEPRYRGDGIASETDDTGTVLDQQKAAMNAVLDDVDGRIRITVLHNDLATPAGDLTADDVIGDYSWVQTPPLPESINVIRGGYIDPSNASLYQMVDYPEVRIDSPDGIDRPQTVNLALVQSPSQAQRLVKQRLQRAQYGGSFTAVFQASAWKYQKGDVVRFSFYPLGWNQKLFRIADMAIQVDGLVPMMLREEHPDIYAWDASDAAAVQGADPSAYDPALWPVIQGIADVDAQVTAIFSDSVITHGKEKRELVQQWAAIEAEFNALDDRYDALGTPGSIATARTNANNAYIALAAALAALNPPWDQLTSDTPVADPSGYAAKWIAARSAIEAFAAAIAGQPGAGAFSLVNVANTTVGTSSVRKVSGGNDTWNGRATTGESYRSASVSAVLCPDSFVALNIVTAGEALDYTSLEYSIHRSGNGNYVGVFRGTNGIASTNRTPVAGARATVTSDGATVRYSYNGEELWSHPVLTPGELVQGAFELIRLDSEITSITFSPAGLAGNSGAPGANAYIHTAFANSADGTVDFTTGAPAGRAFIGTYTDNAAADSTLPGSYEWTAYKGPPGFGLNPRGTAIVAGNTVIKATGANLWDSDCYSTEGWRGGCQLSFRAPVAGSNGMAGINTDPTTDGGYTSLDHAFQFADNGIVYIYESDVGYLTGISYDASTLFQIRYDNKSVIYLINGAIVRTVAKAADLIFYFDSSLCNVGTRITEITWGAAGAAGGDGVTPVLVTAQPEAVTIQTDAGGTPVAGTFPIPIGNAATKGGAGVAISSVTIVTASGVTASVSGSTVNITGYSGGTGGEVVYDVVASGQTVRKRVTVAVTASGSNGAVQQVLRVTTPQLTWTAYQQHGGTVALNASSSGKLQLNLTGSMRVDNGGNDLRFQSKLQYRVSAGTWTDVPGSEAISTRSELLLDPTRIISANVNGSGPYNLTGLTADGAYEVRALTRKYDGSATTTQIVNLSISALQVI